MGAQEHGRPLERITRDDHSGYVVLTIYASFFLTLAFWTARLGIRWRRLGLKMDDMFLIVAMVLALAQSICLHLAVNAGLGTRDSSDGQVQLSDFEKSFYASTLLNILSQACAKVSVSMLFDQFQPCPMFAIANFASLGLAVAWALGSCFAIAFQCDLPSPWKLQRGTCVDSHSMFLGIDITNLISEACLVAVPAVFMPKVQTTRIIRLVVIGCFAARLGVIATLIGHIIVSPNLVYYGNATWAYTLPTIWLQIAMNASILTACIPGMQRVLAELRAGTLTPRVDVEHHDTNMYGSIFRTNASRARADRGKGDGKIWEMARMDSDGGVQNSSRSRDVDTESERRLTDQQIVITKEVSLVQE